MTRRIIYIVVYLLFAPHAEAAVTIVDSAINTATNTGGTTLSVTLTGVAAGDTVCACTTVEGSETISHSDEDGSSYTNIANVLHGSGLPRTRMDCAYNVAGNVTTVTSTLSAQQYRFTAAVAIRGLHTSPSEATNSNTGNSSPVTAGSVTATTNGIVVGCFGSIGGMTITPAAGWTQLQEQESGMYSPGAMAYQLSSASSSYNPQWTISTAVDWNGISVQLKQSATSGRRRSLLGVGR